MTEAKDKQAISPTEATGLLTSFVAATYAFGIYLFSALVPDVRAAFDIGHDVIGIASGAGQAGNMAFAILAGLLVPKIGPIRAMFLFLTTSVACQWAFYGLANIEAMIAVLFVLGGMGSAVWVAIVVASQSLIPAHHRAKALGLMSSGTSFGLFLNGMIVPYVHGNWGWRTVWLVMGSITLLLLATGIWRLRRIASMPGRSMKPGRNDTRTMAAFASPAALFAVVLLFGTAFSLVPYQTYLVSLLRDGVGWSAESAARAWSAIGFGGMVGGALLGTIADRISVRWTLVLTYLLLAATMPVALLAPAEWKGVYAALFVVGMAYFAIFGLIAAYVAHKFPPEIASALSGWSFVAVGFGSMIGNFAGGQVIDALGSYTQVYLGAVVVALLLALVALIMSADQRAARVAS